MHIQSTRFGKIEIREETIIVFPEGLIGLAGHPLRARRPRRQGRVLLAALDRRPVARPAGDRALAVLRRLRRQALR